jgi:hypothetical protein
VRASGFLVVAASFAVSLHAGGVKSTRGDDVDFTRDVRPLLSRHCFKCHGPDDKARKAELRLDRRENALKGGESGEPAIVPKKPEDSELVRRILSDDESEMMPPPAAKLPLSAAQKQIFKLWVEQGGEYVPHWAFVFPRQEPPPEVQNTSWPRNPIDAFVLGRMEAAGLAPSPEADKYTLVRRLYLDLIGMPPSPEEADVFVKDSSPNAYDELVERLLKSPHYGERWARKWLDLARYADTNGYEKDRQRSMWLYRDWVISALNDDMPFDRFTIEQIAGDLLPDAGLSQKIATGFHRNTMINEEGGIDPLEFRFYAMTDRVATTGTAWLGLTLMCCQCHTHKYDPVTQREYYGVMAFLNNADEPVMEVPQADIAARRRETEQKIEDLIADLPNRFPLEGDYRWHSQSPESIVSAGGASPEKLADGSVRFAGPNPEKDTYIAVFETDLPRVDAIRLEALVDQELPSTGPGRTPHGNFVLSEFTVAVAAKAVEAVRPVKVVGATADFSQEGFSVGSAIDGQTTTGWAIHGPGKWNVDRAAIFQLDPAEKLSGPLRWTIKLDQQHGSQHTLGKFRISFGSRNENSRPEDVRRRDHLERRLAEWIERETSRLTDWTVLRPVEAKANMPILAVLDDDSVLASSDQTKRDVYDLKFRGDLMGVTAIRVEALPDERLPARGPGRVYYEGPFGDFFLSNITLAADGEPSKLAGASQTFADGKNTAAMAIDDDLQSGWSINARQGEPNSAVFNLAEPLPAVRELALQMVFEKYYAAGLGRFRISVTTDRHRAEATGLPPQIETVLRKPAEQRTPADKERLLAHFVLVAPELAAEQAAINKLRKEMPAYPTTLVLAERPSDQPRATYIHQRGEFLQPTERVEPGIPAVLPQFAPRAPKNRLAFARWLVSPDHPLTARVTMNRQWAAFFGRGLVRTQEDFGFQGEAPTHPELLDWLAVEFIKRGWSMKQLHRLIVTSATYRQSSRVTAEILAKDPSNRWLSRGPRNRIDAEIVRDSALKISGLFSPKLGGPSVFPPQPPGVTSEGTYGGLAWNVSAGADRYRRGLYTFAKRTAPYAMLSTFDSPSGEACVARREVSNTPLQALTLMNDTVFWEAAQALGSLLASREGSTEERLEYLFRRCLVRPPTPDELRLLAGFFKTQRERLEKKELDASNIAGAGDGDLLERAAWTLVARAVLNLDETITKN